MITQPTATYLHHQIPSGKFSTQLAFFPRKCIIFGCFNSFEFQARQEDDPCYQHPTPPPPPHTHKKKTYHIVFSKESVLLNYM